MGHIGTGKDIFKQLAGKVDGLTMRAPRTRTLFEILKALYTSEEAEVVVRMPYGASTFERLVTVTGIPAEKLRPLLEGLCAKGLVMDICIKDTCRYMPSPMVVGVFEMTMMRTDPGVDSKALAPLFHDYLLSAEGFFHANFKHGEQISVMRTVPHEAAVQEEAYSEILDYDRARELVDRVERFATGICSCRHEKFHIGTKKCDVPLELCCSFDHAADFLIRRHLAREVSKEQMVTNLDRARELGLVMNADNVQKNASFLCLCCGCCCNALAGLKLFGYANAVISSGWLPRADIEKCMGCGACARACPVEVLKMVPDDRMQAKRKESPQADASFCLGCGVCALKCKTGSLRLEAGPKRVIPPETTFRRILLQTLERGTLQNQLFDDPGRLSHKFLRGFVGGFLRLPPVKRALLSKSLRSHFLEFMEAGVRRKGEDWATEL
jgi:NAD-dependent dihydropyrimidine dehydrogenase PreA subunit